MDARKAVPRSSEYLAAEDLAGRGDFALEITNVETPPRPSHWGKSSMDTIMVVTLKGAERKLWINRTNLKAIASHYGWETDDWLGQKITLYIDKARDPDGGGGQVDCIRVVAKGSKRDRMSKMKARQQEGKKP